MNFIAKIKQIKNFSLDLIFPKICLSCQNEGFYLCENCLDKIPLIDKLTCPVCEKITFYGRTCENCQRKTYLTGLFCATSYKNPIINEAIKLLKYKYIKELSGSLAKIMIKLIKNSGFLVNPVRNSDGTLYPVGILPCANPIAERQDISNGVNNFTDELTSFLVIPVPLHHKKFLSRGFNQSELLAQKIAEEFDLELKNGLLIKTKNTRSQTDLKEEKRIINVKDVFEVKNKKEAKDKVILLVDDIFTTGSTLNEAAKALKKSGAREVWGVTLARG